MNVRRGALLLTAAAVVAAATVVTVNSLGGSGSPPHRHSGPSTPGVALGGGQPLGTTAPSVRPSHHKHASSRHARHRPRRSPRLPRPAPTGHGVLVPGEGAYLGAFVQPAGSSAQQQIDAVLTLEKQLGHPLALVHMYHPWQSAFPDRADSYFAHLGQALLLTWGGAPSTTKIIAGDYDSLIRARARALKRLGTPVLLEWRHEMDRPDLQHAMHSPADYIAAWDHIRAIFAAEGATNVGWVWCPTAWGFGSGRAQPFYPGDNEVDWICADGYSASPDRPLSLILQPFLSWASHHPKPVIIGEFGERTDPAAWGPWFAGVGRMVEQDTQIKAMAYFDADGTSGRGLGYRFSLTHSPGGRAEFATLLADPYFHPPLPGS